MTLKHPETVERNLDGRVDTMLKTLGFRPYVDAEGQDCNGPYGMSLHIKYGPQDFQVTLNAEIQEEGDPILMSARVPLIKEIYEDMTGLQGVFRDLASEANTRLQYRKGMNENQLSVGCIVPMSPEDFFHVDLRAQGDAPFEVYAELTDLIRGLGYEILRQGP